MPATSATKRSTLRLSEVARHIVIPDGIASTGWPAIREQCREFGDTFDEWQDGAGRLILGKRPSGLYAATVGGVTLSIPRQVAKTWLVSRIVFALCVLFPGLRVIWTAHRTRTTTNTFRNLIGYTKRRAVAPYIASVRTANGEQEIVFHNRSIIMFGAREQGFGRGFDEIDIEVFDEAQILTEKALDDMVAATNQSRHPHGALLFYLGTPPRPVDPGEVFTLRREKALGGKSTDAVYIECSADVDADPDDRQQWAKANPSFPHRTPLASMLRLRENLGSDESWLREALGIWSPATTTAGVIPFDAWLDRGDANSVAVEDKALGIEVGPDLAWASVSLAGRTIDGRWHVELDERRDGAAWLVAYVDALVQMNPDLRAVVADVGGPIVALLEQRSGNWYLGKTRITAPTVKELGSACSMILNLTVTGGLVHPQQPQLDVAVQVAGKRALGDTGMWVFSRKSATSDITPIQGAALALHGAQMAKPNKPARSGRGSNGRVATVL